MFDGRREAEEGAGGRRGGGRERWRWWRGRNERRGLREKARKVQRDRGGMKKKGKGRETKGKGKPTKGKQMKINLNSDGGVELTAE